MPHSMRLQAELGTVAAPRPAPFLAPALTSEQRMAAGKALRKSFVRTAHGQFTPGEASSGRDVVALLQAEARTRIGELVPVRHARMLESPFAFFRGSAALMAQDLAASPRTGLDVQACGDMHVSNFGVFASAERQLVFAINDFDETQPGPWEWDLKRLVASAVLVARYTARDRAGQQAAAQAVVAAYRRHMRRFARMGNLELWYQSIDSDALLVSLSLGARERAGAIMRKARRRDHLQVLDKLTDLVDDQYRIIEQHPLVVCADSIPVPGGDAPIEVAARFLEAYLQSVAPERRLLLRRYRLVDVALKVVGVGSVGTRCWVLFLMGQDAGDPLFLQVKEAQPSVLTPYLPRGPFAHEGQRVVVGQRLIQGSPDIFLGWGSLDGVQYYVRQLRDMKGSAEFELGEGVATHLAEYCGLCGWALALAHAKSGDAARIAGYVGKSDELDVALAAFAQAYADQTERDHATMAAAARAGKLAVAKG